MTTRARSAAGGPAAPSAPPSRMDELLAANAAFLDRRPPAPVRRCLDVPCGAGDVLRMLRQRLPEARLYGVDRNCALVAQAAAVLRNPTSAVSAAPADADVNRPVRPEAAALAVAALADLPFAEASFDCVTVTNAIHTLADKPRFIAGVARLLPPGGLFGFTSGFYAGTFPAGTERFYLEWLKAAAIRLAEINAARRASGQPAIPRIRGTAGKAFQNRWLGVSEWTALLAEHGFAVCDVHERFLHLDGRFFASMGAYQGLARVLLSGYPIAVACDALGSTAETVLQALGLTVVPRRWLEVWARKC